MIPECMLNDEVFICQYCQKEFDVTQGSWPLRTWDDELIIDTTNEADWGNIQFCCYDCIE